MKKTIIGTVLVLLSGSFCSTSFASNEVIPVSPEEINQLGSMQENDNNAMDTSDGLPQENYRKEEATINSNDVSITSGNVQEDGTVGNLIMTTGAKISDKGVNEITNLQEEQAILNAKINTEQSRKTYLQLQKDINELNLGTGNGGSIVEPELLGSHGMSGNIKATISLNGKVFDVKKGDVVNRNLEVKRVYPKKVHFHNTENNENFIIQFNGPAVYKR